MHARMEQPGFGTSSPQMTLMLPSQGLELTLLDFVGLDPDPACHLLNFVGLDPDPACYLLHDSGVPPVTGILSLFVPAYSPFNRLNPKP